MNAASHSGAWSHVRRIRVGFVAWALPVLAVAIAAAAVRAGEGDDILLRVYADGTAERRALFAESADHLDRVRAKALLNEPAVDWNTDPDVLWLLDHRQPAALVVEGELAGSPSGRYLGALAQLGLRLGYRSLRQKLPGLLAVATTDADRLEVIRVLGELRTPEAVQVLQGYLRGKRTVADELLVCEAARGLGLTRDKVHQALLLSVARFVQSPAGRARLVVARYRCGDDTAVADLLTAVREGTLEAGALVDVLEALAERPSAESLTDLSSLAVRSEEPRVADAAFQALACATGYSVPPADVRAQARQDGVEGEAPGEDPLGLNGVWHEKTPPQREEIVGRLAQWQEEHRESRSSPSGLFGIRQAVEDETKPR